MMELYVGNVGEVGFERAATGLDGDVNFGSVERAIRPVVQRDRR